MNLLEKNPKHLNSLIHVLVQHLFVAYAIFNVITMLYLYKIFFCMTLNTCIENIYIYKVMGLIFRQGMN